MTLTQVLGVAAGEFQDLRAESQRERQNADANTPSGQEMPQFVHEHQDTQDEEECEKSCKRADHYTVNSSARATSSACDRAQRSTRRTVSSVETRSTS